MDYERITKAAMTTWEPRKGRDRSWWLVDGSEAGSLTGSFHGFPKLLGICVGIKISCFSHGATFSNLVTKDKITVIDL